MRIQVRTQSVRSFDELEPQMYSCTFPNVFKKAGEHGPETCEIEALSPELAQLEALEALEAFDVVFVR